jgi:hypothetical protein
MFLLDTSLDLILQIAPENPDHLKNPDWIANMINIFSEKMNIRLQVEPISQGLIFFCEKFQSLFPVINVLNQFTMPQDNFQPNGPIWYIKIVQKDESLSFEEVSEFLQTIGSTIFGPYHSLQYDAEQDHFVATFPDNSSIHSYLISLSKSEILGEK